MTVRGLLALVAVLTAAAGVTGGAAMVSTSKPTADAGTTMAGQPVVPSLVCPGPESSADAATVVAAASGPAELFFQSQGDLLRPTSDVDSTKVTLSSGAAVLTGAGGSVAAAQSTLARNGPLRGLTASACRSAFRDAWLVGGATASNHRLRLALTNPYSVPAVVDLDVRGPEGPVQAPSGTGITIRGYGQQVIALDALTPGLDALAVHVTARSGRIRASMLDSVQRDGTSGGVDEVPQTASPGRHQVIPGVGSGVVRVVAPGGRDALVSMQLLGPTGVLSSGTAQTTVRAGTVSDLKVNPPQGSYAAVISADQPVLAAALVTRDSDFGWAAATEPLAGGQLVALPAGADSGLVLTAAGAAGRVTLRTVGVGGALGPTQTIPVPAGSTIRLPLDSAPAIWLAPVSSGPVRAALLAEADGFVSVLPVPDAPGSRAPTRIVQDAGLAAQSS